MGVLGVILIAIGAILAFAVNASVSGLDIAAVGVILMIVGAVAVLASILQGSFLGFRSRTSRQLSQDGRTVVEESRTSPF